MLDLCLLCPIEILILQAAPYLCPSLLLPLLWHHAMSSMYLLQHPLLTQQFTPQSTLPPSLLSNPATDISLVFPPRTTPPTALVLPCQEIILMPHNMVGVSILAPQQPLPSLPHTLLLQVADIPTTQDILPPLSHPLPFLQEVILPSPYIPIQLFCPAMMKNILLRVKVMQGIINIIKQKSMKRKKSNVNSLISEVMMC